MDLAAGGLQALVDAHYAALFRYAYRLTGSAADAEDLTQEAFRKAFTRLPQLREPDRARAWVFRILRNLYLHRVRDEKRRRSVPLDAIGDLPAPDGESRDAIAIEPEQLQQVLNELDEGFRTPLILFYFEEFSYRDIAEQMDLPIGTVMSRLARAKGYLRAKLNSSSSAGEAECAGDQTEGVVKARQKNERKGPKEVTDAMP